MKVKEKIECKFLISKTKDLRLRQISQTLRQARVVVLLFFAITVMMFLGCQTVEETISRTDLSDYGARHYHSEILRFSTIDPVAEKYPQISPYAYTVKHPIYIDLQGDSLTVANDTVSTKPGIWKQINR